MAEIFVMPQASPTMEVGTLISWRKAEGDRLNPQDVLAEVETDKATTEIEVFDEGYLLKLLITEGTEVPAGAPIAIIGRQPGEDISALLASAQNAPAAPKAAPAAEPAAPTPEPKAAPTPAPVAAPAPSLHAGITAFTWRGQSLPDAIMEMPADFVVALEAEVDGNRPVRAAPAARKAARELGVNLQGVAGTGPRGRILREDVEKAGSRPAAIAAAPTVAGPADEVIRNSQMRKTIARRLKSVWVDAPVFYLTAVFECDALVSFRDQLKAGGLKVSYNDLVVKACAKALKDVPAVNASWGEEAITRHGAVHIGMAVALPDGLITPVLRNADQKGLSAISAETRDLAVRARDRKLAPEEYQGSTFTISNLGMMGIEQFTAILNPPEAMILAVGSMQQEPVVRNGQLTVGHRMRVTLTCDHRVVDGALGAEFLQAVRRYLENPALLAG